jgi:hypothetical protein
MGGLGWRREGGIVEWGGGSVVGRRHQESSNRKKRVAEVSRLLLLGRGPGAHLRPKVWFLPPTQHPSKRVHHERTRVASSMSYEFLRIYPTSSYVQNGRQKGRDLGRSAP